MKHEPGREYPVRTRWGQADPGFIASYTSLMFTGLIQAIGLIRERLDRPEASRLIVDIGDWKIDPRLGDSIAVSGCCLTVADRGSHGELFFDVVPQSLARTTLGRAHPGRKVNLEAPATPETLLGGHVVQGHVDGVGIVRKVVRDDEYRLRVEVEPELMQYMTPRGSVAIEGVSMTLAHVDPGANCFELAVIPTTLRETNLGDLDVGDEANIECDVIAKTVIHWLRHYGGPTARSIEAP